MPHALLFIISVRVSLWTLISVSLSDLSAFHVRIWTFICSVRVLLTFTCRPRGFQRTFLSRAGVELRVFWGLFFSVRMTPHGSSLKALTRFFSCQPTWRAHTHTHIVSVEPTATNHTHYCARTRKPEGNHCVQIIKCSRKPAHTQFLLKLYKEVKWIYLVYFKLSLNCCGDWLCKAVWRNPREFHLIFSAITKAVDLPPAGGTARAALWPQQSTNSIKPDKFFIIAVDFNHAYLLIVLPEFQDDKLIRVEKYPWLHPNCFC